MKEAREIITRNLEAIGRNTQAHIDVATCVNEQFYIDEIANNYDNNGTEIILADGMFIGFAY